MKTKPNDPINPSTTLQYSGNAQLGDIKVTTDGLTKREYFAALALQGLLSYHGGGLLAERAVEQANALIYELNKY
ncbi:hypothetical protein [Pedobacter zeae]|uniref:Uncharacterized protein n=1 Tax=Pedobacter zeae TaxID=1737356 RepID=A0A7W6K7I5_9SPHI|nr:hypothetical protein [Pedobacter zeae]MBB4106638.1 hypothetical protein [Pedobacter zeae]GGH02878.1 hypothetical protein GCM10007422_17580 [Pedobacter zeae]